MTTPQRYFRHGISVHRAGYDLTRQSRQRDDAKRKPTNIDLPVQDPRSGNVPTVVLILGLCSINGGTMGCRMGY